jgi:hypothetical protein
VFGKNTKPAFAAAAAAAADIVVAVVAAAVVRAGSVLRGCRRGRESRHCVRA